MNRADASRGTEVRRGQGQAQQGFTLVELLVAIALLGVMLAVVVPGITGLLGVNRSSERELNTTTQAQRALEEVKGAWQAAPGLTDAQLSQVRARFDSNCVPGLVLPTGVTLQSRPLDSRAQTPGILGNVSVAASCPAATGTTPAMRRVTVTAGTGTQATTLTLDVLRPQ
ncbi:type II secretion system protein [Deinococcus sp. YIM 134068]|uniref:type II secretion system protein n=1 Tax=Deinococcus lichenicola TaxID=3118910 RepID=UPI002F93718C